MKKTLIIAAAVIAAAALCLAGLDFLKLDTQEYLAGERYRQHEQVCASPLSGEASVPADMHVGDDFETHLPLIVIDTDGTAIPDGTGSDGGSYVSATATVYDCGGVNSPSGQGVRLICRIKNRGAAEDSAKHQYRLKLLDTFGDKSKYPLLGMARSDEWNLDGSEADVSCMRNYIGYTLAAEAGLNSPDVRYCEVLLADGDGYEYLGLYLLTEPVEQGKGRVEFKGKRSLVGAYSYIVKRDGEDSDRPLLETRNYKNGTDIEVDGKDRLLTLVYPKGEKATEQAVRYVTEDISRVEEVLYTDFIYSQAAVRDCINVDSFINYQLVNEFMMNRDAGKRSTYMYRDIGGELTMGPVWGFNDSASGKEPELLTVGGMPMFDRLMLNGDYTRLLAKRLAELRKGSFSEQDVAEMISGTEEFLGNALLRDYSRRASFDPDCGQPQEDIAALKTILTERGAFLDKYFGEVYG